MHGVKNLLNRLSIAFEVGKEIFSYNKKGSRLIDYDPELIKGFMSALQSISEAFHEPIHQIQLADMMLYMKSFEKYHLQLLFEEQMETEAVDKFFRVICEIIDPVFEKSKNQPDEESLRIELNSFIQDLEKDRLSVTLDRYLKKSAISKIAIIGLAKAGKTSIKNQFFESWSKERIGKIQPTLGVEVLPKFIDYLQQRLLIYDYGGQAIYREQYLNNPKQWENLSIIFFIVDIQDQPNYKAAKIYLDNVWKMIIKHSKNPPKLAIFFHKCDISIRKRLNVLIKEAILHFKDYINVASFHLTTIEDSSGLTAFIKTLYFSLPEVLLAKIFVDEFISHFENELLVKFNVITDEKEFVKYIKDEKAFIKQAGVEEGLKYGKSLQESWLYYILGELKPQNKVYSSKRITISRVGQYLYVTIPDWKEKNYPLELTTTLIDGMLEGVMKTFHMDKPKISEKTGSFTTWQIVL